MLTGAFPYLKELMPNKSEAAILTKVSMVVATLPLSQVISAPILGKVADYLQSIRTVSITRSVVFTGSIHDEKSRIEEVFEKIADKWQGTDGKRRGFVRCNMMY